MKTLNIIESAYRATVEEQDDTIVWITTAMKGAGADIGVLLTGRAVNYAVANQDATGLSFGAVKQTQPPQLGKDITRLVDKGVDVYVVDEDVSELGLERNQLVPGLKNVARSGVAKLFGEYERVWHW